MIQKSLLGTAALILLTQPCAGFAMGKKPSEPQKSPYRYDDGIRFECDELLAPQASFIMTQEAISKKLITPEEKIQAWREEGSKNFHVYFGRGSSGFVEEVLELKWVPVTFATQISPITLSCAGVSGKKGSAHLAHLSDYSDLVPAQDVQELRCLSNSSDTQNIDIILVKDQLSEVALNNNLVTNSCRFTNGQVECHDSKDLRVDVSKRVTIPPSDLDWFLSVIGGNSPQDSQAYLGSIKGGSFNSRTFDVICY